jgi:hypothetical protein
MCRHFLKPALLGLAACGMLLVADSAQAGRHRRYHGGYYGYGYNNGCDPCGQQPVSPCSPCGGAAYDQGMQNSQGQMNQPGQPYSSGRPIYQQNQNGAYQQYPNGNIYQDNQGAPVNQFNAPAPNPSQRTFQNAPANQPAGVNAQGSAGVQVNPNTNRMQQNVNDNTNRIQQNVNDNVNKTLNNTVPKAPPVAPAPISK